MRSRPDVGGQASRGNATVARVDRAREPRMRSAPAGLRPAPGGCICSAMSRTLPAILVGLLGLALYVGAVVALADRVIGTHWLVEALYYLVAGVAWAFPIRWLMGWAARRPAPGG